jgi:hypothetical protein
MMSTDVNWQILKIFEIFEFFNTIHSGLKTVKTENLVLIDVI